MFEEQRLARLRSRMLYIEDRSQALRDGTAETWTTGGGLPALQRRLDVLGRDYERAWQKYRALMTRLYGPNPEDWPKS